MKKILIKLLLGDCIIIKKTGKALVVDARASQFSDKEMQNAATLFFKEAYKLTY